MFVAVAISTENIGVDIEKIGDKIRAVAPKFEADESLCRSLSDEEITAIWTIKEATYKYINQKGLSLKSDIKVLPQQNYLNAISTSRDAPTTKYFDALKMFNEKEYATSFELFQDISKTSSESGKELKSNSNYYLAKSALYERLNGAELYMLNFLKVHPTSPYKNSAYWELAKYYFGYKDYQSALFYFEKIDMDNVGSRQLREYQFKKGFSLFKAGNYTDAIPFFNAIKSDEDYGNRAKYYLGHIAYQTNEYDKANSFFGSIINNDTLKENLAYYKAYMDFKKGSYKSAIEFAMEQLKANNTPRDSSSLNRIIAESYIALKQYDKALPHLEKYREKLKTEDIYQLGYTYYKTKNYEKATEYFNKLKDLQNIFSQNAYYHLGVCYVHLNKKLEALKSFIEASKMAYSSPICQDAWLKRVKLSYEVGNPFENSVSVMDSFLKKYPDSPYKSEVQDYLVTLYIKDKDYDRAIDLLSDKKSFKSKKNFQLVTFLKALNYFKEEDYDKAKDFFYRSSLQAIDSIYTLKAIYYQAHSDFYLGNYNESLSGLKTVLSNHLAKTLPEFNTLDYLLGYTYLKTGDKQKAIEHFRKVSEKSGSLQVKEDSFLKLGDIFFEQEQYWQAAEYYQKGTQIALSHSDYALFRKALSYALVKRISKAIKNSLQFLVTYKTSAYRDDVFYLLAKSYSLQQEFDKSVSYYDSIKIKYPTSYFLPKAILGQGLLYKNNDKQDQAEYNFKKLVKDFPEAPETLEAITEIKRIYVERDQIKTYVQWLKTTRLNLTEDLKADFEAFKIAKETYEKDKTTSLLKAYLQKFPKGFSRLNVHYLIASNHLEKKEDKKAIEHLKIILKQKKNRFTEPSLIQLSKIYLDRKDTADAIESLHRLEREATFYANIKFAQLKLMKLYFESDDKGHSLDYANKITSDEKADDNAKQQAYIIKNRIFISNNNWKEAKATLKNITIDKTRVAAELYYYQALIQQHDKEFEASNKTILGMTKNFPSSEFLPKALVTMAQNCASLQDNLQAKFVVEGVLKNYKLLPKEVKDMAKKLLDKLK
ncbi:tetratricopeptide repeat-containing protein [Elysia marginata]|uniref:Cell division cycle protein 27 homolog n=1 Tax=Elysia marginata TaxID=1093978 RepID=A0AAV4G5T8_9GAST|nr:tetratricopeptide repeat-containing protein [Elysia marginata]